MTILWATLTLAQVYILLTSSYPESSYMVILAHICKETMLEIRRFGMEEVSAMPLEGIKPINPEQNHQDFEVTKSTCPVLHLFVRVSRASPVYIYILHLNGTGLLLPHLSLCNKVSNISPQARILCNS